MKWHEKDRFASLRGLSDFCARPFARIPPNMVTLFGAILVLPMFWAFWNGHTLLGGICFGLSTLTDFLDGALADYQKRHLSEIERRREASMPEFLRRGPTDLGAAFDPFVDKIRFFAALASLGWSLFPLWLRWSAATLALILTLGRLVVGKTKANRWGKYKTFAEIGLISALVLRSIGIPIPMSALNALLASAVGLAFMSVMGQIQTWLAKRKNASS